MRYLPWLAALLALWLLLRLTARGTGAWRGRRHRHRLEDALKHVFEQEYRGRRATPESLAGALGIPAARAFDLVVRMQALGLMRPAGPELALTAAGQRLALQVVRAHRLLERYFADEARLPLRRVHAEAERREHALSPADADRLSAHLGHPTLDPHGDPIPTCDGELAPPVGAPATSCPLGTPARIVHLEDEPEISYAQILACGLTVGQHVRVTESTATRLVLSDGENEFPLAPAVAANVFLVPAPEEAGRDATRRLSELPRDQPAVVVALDEACQGYSRRRLMDLGFTEGARVRARLATFSGDPRGYEVRGTLVALRREQAAAILVRPLAAERGASQARAPAR